MRTKGQELVRNIFHMLCMSSVSIGVFILDFRESVVYLGGLTLSFVFLDFMRRYAPFLQSISLFLFKNIIRMEEEKKLTGSSYALLGSVVVLCIFPKEVAAISILMLALGDPSSNFVGIKYGRDKLIGDKSLQGTIACFVVCSLISFLFLIFFNGQLLFERALIISLLGGAIGAFFEVVPIFKINDNFTMPVCSGCGMWSLYLTFGVI